MSVFWPILLTWVATGVATHLALREQLRELTIRAMRLIPGFREALLNKQPDPLLQLLLTAFGWPLLIFVAVVTRKHLDHLQGGEDFKHAIERLRGAEALVAEAPIWVRGYPQELSCDKEETAALRQFVDLVEPIFKALGAERALVGPSEEQPFLFLWRRPAKEGVAAFSIVARVGLRLSLSTWADELRHSGTRRELRLYFVAENEGLLCTFCRAACDHCFNPIDIAGGDRLEPAVRADVTAAVNGVVAALAMHTRSCPRQERLGLVSDDPKLDVRDALRDNAERLGRAFGQVEDAAAGVGPAVVHAHGDAPAGVDVGDEQLRAELQRAVSGGEAARVEDLAVRGEVPLEPGAVPARLAGLEDGRVDGGGRGARPAREEEQRADPEQGGAAGDGGAGSHS